MTAHSAMHLSPSGSGQVLIFPYYAATSKVDTLLSIFNDSDESKAVRVRFVEGLHGQVALQYNLYLAPRDVWVGAVSNRSGLPKLSTSDASCTVPTIGADGFAIPHEFELYLGIEGTPAEFPLEFHQMPGQTVVDVTGFIEVIEMGVLEQSPLNDQVQNQGSGCGELTEAWGEGGIWANDPEIHLSTPTGHLSGNASLINVAEGIEYGYKATAIAGFFDPLSAEDSASTLHRKPNDPHPALTDADTSGQTGLVDSVQTLVIHPQGPVLSNWPRHPDDDSARADPISALFMSATLGNEVIIDQTLDGHTNLIVTYPTLRHYAADSGVPLGEVVGPITGPFAPQPNAVNYRNVYGLWVDQFHRFWARNGEENDDVGYCFLVCEDTIDFGIGVVQIIIAGRGETGIDTGAPESLFGLRLATGLRGSQAGTLVTNGHATIGFESDSSSYPVVRTLTSAPDPETGEYHIYHGLPALGFAAIRLVNGDVLAAGGENTRANYGRTADHVVERRIDIIRPGQ